MNWDIEAVSAALSVEPPQEQRGSAVSLPLFDQTRGIGIGVDGLGAGTLVLPGQELLAAFETKALLFEPWCDTTWVEGAVALPKSAVLRCRFDRADEELLQLVSGILISLVDLQLRFDDAGKALWRLRELFGEGFDVAPQVSVVRGLLGELIVILASPDPSAAVEAWHVDADDRYDFSAGANRLEVKATSAVVRMHRFNSRQLPALHGLDVWVASVQLAEVAIGDSVATIFDQLASALPTHLSRKLSDVIVETVGIPPAAISTPKIDLQTTVAGIRIFPAASVPTPMRVAGTSDVRWTAYLDDEDGFPGLGLAPIFAAA